MKQANLQRCSLRHSIYPSVVSALLLGASLSKAPDQCYAGSLPRGHASWEVRGCNYYPRDYPWAQGAMWTRCPTGIYEVDCARMQSLGVNMARVFVPVILTPDHAWYADDWTASDKLRHQLDAFLGACQTHGIKAILCFDVDKASIDDGRASVVNAQLIFPRERGHVGVRG